MIHVNAQILGRQVEVTLLKPEDIDIEDIAHTLSKINRFGGRTPYPYSVAQHAVLVSYLTGRKNAYEGLHHDDTEAYVGDIIGTFKTEEQRFIEQRVRELLAPVLGLARIEPPAVKDADQRALRFEQQLLQGRSDVKIAGLPLGQLDHIREVKAMLRPLHPRRAAELFIERHEELTAGYNPQLDHAAAPDAFVLDEVPA